MEPIYLLIFLIFIFVIVYFFFFRKNFFVLNKQKEIDSKIFTADNKVIMSPIETGATKPIENNIKKTMEDIQEVSANILEKEHQIEEIKNTFVKENSIKDPQTGADWVNSVLKKKDSFIILFCILTPSFIFAADPLFQGKAYIPKQNGVALSMEELNSMKVQIEEGVKLKKLNDKYESLLEDYRKLKILYDQQIENFVTLDKLKQESLLIYKESINIYKDIIGEMRANNQEITKNLSQQRKISRFQRNLNFVIGFLAPVLGARALNQLGK